MMNIHVSFDYSVTDIVERIERRFPDMKISFMHFRPFSEWQALAHDKYCSLASGKRQTPEQAADELFQLLCEKSKVEPIT